MNQNNKWTMQYRWTQPYSNWNYPVKSVTNEIAVIEAIDNIVNSMTTYSDAQQLIKKYFTLTNGNNN